MKNMSFRALTMLGFSIIIAMFSGIVGFCIFELRQIERGVAHLETEVLPYELLANQMAFNVVQVQQFLTDASLTQDRKSLIEAEKFAKSFREGVNSMRDHYTNHQQQLEELNQVEAAFGPYYENGKRMADAYTVSKEAGDTAMAVFDKTADVLTQKMSTLRAHEVASATARVNAVDASASRAIYVSLGVALLGILLGIFIAWKQSSKLLNEIGIDPLYAKGIAKEIAKGNLSRDITLNPGDNSSLLFAMRAMQIKLREVISEVSNNANAIVASANHLANSAQTVLTGSKQQNDAATNVAAAVEQMTASIEQISSNADHSERIAKQSGDISDQGSKVVSDAVEEMNKIASSVSQSSEIIRDLGMSSQKISEIVNVIKEIADQTNLLALNAAIEAARAGEQGRGFAVVADEVRKLAERTSSATQEISGMIGAIQSGANNAVSSMEQGTIRVGEGVEKAQRAGASMAQVKQGTEQVVLTVGDITNALKEQSRAVNSVAREVEMIASMVNENTLAVDELARTSEELNRLAEDLHQSVSHFNA